MGVNSPRSIISQRRAHSHITPYVYVAFTSIDYLIALLFLNTPRKILLVPGLA